MNKELLLYIKTQIDLGTPTTVIKELLVTRGGWRESDVDEAIRTAATPLPPQPVVKPQPVALNVAVQPKELETAKTTPITAPTPVPAPQPVSSPIVTPKPVVDTPAPVPTPAPASVRVPGTTLVQPVAPVVKPIIDIAAPAPTPVVTPVSAPISPATSTPVAPVSVPAPIPVATPAAAPIATPLTPMQSAPVSPVSTMTTMMPRQDGMAMNMSSMSNLNSVQPVPKKGTKALLLTTILLLVLLVGGAGAYAYMTYLSPKPTVAFAHVAQLLSESKTGQYKATITTSFDTTGFEPFLKKITKNETPAGGVQISENTTASLTVKLDGAFDMTDAAAPKTMTTIGVATTAVPMTLSVQTITLGKTLYVKLPDLSFLNDVLGGNASAFLPGDWVSLARSEIGEATGGAIEVPETTPEVTGKIVNFFLQGGVIVPTLELSKDKYNDIAVHRYQFSVDKTALKQAILQSSLALSGAPLQPEEATMVDSLLNSMNIADGELWVGVWDRKPYKMSFTLKPGADAQEIAAVKFEITFDGFGAPVSITVPTSAKPFLSLLTDYQKKAHDSGVKAGLVSVGPLAEIYYASKKSYTGLCTSPNGLASLLQSYTSGTYCKDSARAYAVALPLMTETGVACIDASTKIVTLAAAPTGTVCK